jgi:hypothetical protein
MKSFTSQRRSVPTVRFPTTPLPSIAMFPFPSAGLEIMRSGRSEVDGEGGGLGGFLGREELLRGVLEVVVLITLKPMV